MKTITKADIAEKIEEAYNASRLTKFATLPRTLPRILVNELIEHIRLCLFDLRPVAFKGWGKLQPCFKKGGRPVRNPKTGETFAMDSIYTVVKARTGHYSTNGYKGQKVNTGELIDHMGTVIKDYFPRLASRENEEFARLVVMTLVDEINNLDTEHRIELRGLGVFYVRTYEPRVCRNPKSGERIERGVKSEIRFKQSALLKRELNEIYQCES